VHPIAQILTHKAWKPLNPSHHEIRAKRHQLEPLNWPRSKRRPRGRRWAASWSQKSTGAAAHYCPCLEEWTHCRDPSWSCSSPRFTPGKDPVDPCIVLPPKPCVTIPWRAWEWSSTEHPMAPPWRAYAPPLSAGFDVSRTLVDGGRGLHHRYPFVLIRSKPPEINQRPRLIYYAVDSWAKTMDPVHGTVDLFHRIFSRKII
jgi:hypothetical protein